MMDALDEIKVQKCVLLITMYGRMALETLAGLMESDRKQVETGQSVSDIRRIVTLESAAYHWEQVQWLARAIVDIGGVPEGRVIYDRYRAPIEELGRGGAFFRSITTVISSWTNPNVSPAPTIDGYTVSIGDQTWTPKLRHAEAIVHFYRDINQALPPGARAF